MYVSTFDLTLLICLAVERCVMCMWAGSMGFSYVLGVVTCHNTSYLGRAQSVPRKAVPDVAPPEKKDQNSSAYHNDDNDH